MFAYKSCIQICNWTAKWQWVLQSRYRFSTITKLAYMYHDQTHTYRNENLHDLAKRLSGSGHHSNCVSGSACSRYDTCDETELPSWTAAEIRKKAFRPLFLPSTLLSRYPALALMLRRLCSTLGSLALAFTVSASVRPVRPRRR